MKAGNGERGAGANRRKDGRGLAPVKSACLTPVPRGRMMGLGHTLGAPTEG